MKLIDWLIGEWKSKDEEAGLHVIGTCGDCTQFTHSGDPNIYEGHCDSDLHSTPENCYQDFGCIHFEKKEATNENQGN